jgi:hypothetical protein
MDEPTPLDFLRAVYLNEGLPLSVRMRAAIECAPYMHPKLGAVAVGYLNADGFAARLDRALQRSALVQVIEHSDADAPEQVEPASAGWRR